MYPSYLEAYNNGKLKETQETAFKMLESCRICPRKCGVNRLKNEKGFCKTGLLPKVCSFMAHHGEEPPVSGERGSGTIFFSNCNMACLYCQNYEFSQLEQGREAEFEELAKFMLELQAMGCHNINLVTPTHVMPQILKALTIAIPQGLKIPLVYNTGGYELAEMIKMLEGIVDIYLPDARYADPELSLKYSNAPDYPKHNRQALKEMHRQQGVAQMDHEGIIKKGLIIRHLVLPNRISGTEKIMEFISKELSPETYISLMSQYLPYHKANQFKDISRRLTDKEYDEAKEIMREYGLDNGWIQESFGLERFAGVNIKPRLKAGEENKKE
ncbi:MAG: radical SAM protein [Candidatus Omnitrophica bacterium]|nr:radical SAM protein [Candidatus Omnitrophota bacterium]